MAGVRNNPPVRGTQLLVEHMGEVFRRPSLVAIEVGWRWLFGIPFLLVCSNQTRRILTAFPLESSGINEGDTHNPWIAAAQLSNLVSFYKPHVALVLRWLLPGAAVLWTIVSGLGRALLLCSMKPRLPFRPITLIFLHATWLALFVITFWGWFRSMQWVASAYITPLAEPDLVGYFVWAIFLSLGFFTAFALVSWPFSVAPVLALFESRSALSALAQSFRLGAAFSGKLAEINLVLGIVKLALLVVAMVFSAAPLPFSDELGPGAMHMVWTASAIIFLIADDYFQVVRLKALVEFWKVYRGQPAA